MYKPYHSKISWLKYEKDKKSFRLPQALGFDVFLLDDLDKTDETMKKFLQDHPEFLENALKSDEKTKKSKFTLCS